MTYKDAITLLFFWYGSGRTSFYTLIQPFDICDYLLILGAKTCVHILEMGVTVVHLVFVLAVLDKQQKQQDDFNLSRI